jgi:hypothetical protein
MNCAENPQFPVDIQQAYFQAAAGVLPLSGPELLPARHTVFSSLIINPFSAT